MEARDETDAPNDRPIVTIVTVARNEEKTIGRTMESVRRQDWPYIDHILIDAASTDGTVAEAQASGKRDLRVLSEPDKGIAEGMNKGIRLARGDIILHLNAGDVLANDDVIRKAAESYQEHKWGWSYGSFEIVSLAGKTIPGPELRTFDYNVLLWYNFIPHMSTFVSREVFEKHGPFDESFKIAMDYEFWLRIGKTEKPQVLPFVVSRWFEGGISGGTLKPYLERRRARAIHIPGNSRWPQALKDVDEFISLFIGAPLKRAAPRPFALIQSVKAALLPYSRRRQSERNKIFSTSVCKSNSATRIILVDTAEGPGGAERYGAQLLNELGQRGYDVAGAGPTNGGLNHTIGLINKKIVFHPLPKVPTLGSGRRSTLSFTVQFFFARRRLVRAVKRFGPARLILSMPSEQMLLAPEETIWIVHPFATSWARSWPGLMRRARRAQVVVSTCEASLPILKRGGIEKLLVARGAAATPQVVIPKTKLDLDDGIWGVQVGRIEPEKGVDVLLDAAELLVKRGLDPKLALIGTGYKEDHYRRRVADGILAGRVRFLGQRDDAPSLVSTFDYAILASFSETFPIAVSEALASGVPVIATDVGDVKWLASRVPGAVTVVPPGNSEALANSWESLLKNLSQAQQAASVAATELETYLSPGRMADDFEKAIELANSEVCPNK